MKGRRRAYFLLFFLFVYLFVSRSIISLEKSDAHEKVIPHWKTFGIKIVN